MLDSSDLVHMNGRVYDPTVGRFLSADIFVQAPSNTQSYNRYSYVLNNPLSYTDPSGYVSLGSCQGLGGSDLYDCARGGSEEPSQEERCNAAADCVWHNGAPVSRAAYHYLRDIEFNGANSEAAKSFLKSLTDQFTPSQNVILRKAKKNAVSQLQNAIEELSSGKLTRSQKATIKAFLGLDPLDSDNINDIIARLSSTLDALLDAKFSPATIRNLREYGVSEQIIQKTFTDTRPAVAFVFPNNPKRTIFIFTGVFFQIGRGQHDQTVTLIHEAAHFVVNGVYGTGAHHNQGLDSAEAIGNFLGKF